MPLESCARDPGPGELRFPVEGFLMKYGASIPRHVFDNMQTAMIEGHTHFIMSMDDFEMMLINHRAYKRLEDRLLKTAELNQKGIELEKLGDIQSAIEVYEENIKTGYHASHSYERLMVIYRRQKQHLDELRVLDRAIEVYSQNPGRGPLEKYIQRRDRLLIKMKKEGI